MATKKPMVTFNKERFFRSMGYEPFEGQLEIHRSKASRRPSFFTTRGSTSSTRSYVVNRRAQVSHSRRRRMTSPAVPARESVTLLSRWPQNGHFKVGL